MQVVMAEMALQAERVTVPVAVVVVLPLQQPMAA